ncbi:hypothetical protein KFU94_57075 [Chloroflexi bacterium TSY]|nr:hypothetical protein [Chloroflexi bacterium TSY]
MGNITRKDFNPYLVLLFVLTLFALTPLAAPGYFYAAHDGRHSVFFVTMFDEAIQDGALWPRWAMHHSQGYGYPTFLIQAPLTFYAAELFVLLGLGITNAVKIVWALGFWASAWGMYALIQHWLPTTDDSPRAGGSWAHSSPFASLAGLLYVYAPYHLVDIYVRAAFAETTLMAWLPWTFLAFDRLIAGGTTSGWQGRLLVAALSFVGLLLTHAFALLAVTPLLVGFVLFRLWLAWDHDALTQCSPRHWRRFLPTVTLAGAGGIAALLLTAIFILPLLVEGPLLAQEDYTRATYYYEQHWVYWSQFLDPFWGYGFSDDPDGANDGMSFQLGLLHALLALVALYLLLQNRRVFLHREPERSSQSSEEAAQMTELRYTLHLLFFFWLASVALLFTMTPAATWLWRTMPMLAVIQFPWRLLALSSFTISALGGLTTWILVRTTPVLLPKQVSTAGILVVGLLVLFASFGYSQPNTLQPIERWREDGRAIFQFEQEHPDMFGYTDLVAERFTETPMTAQYAAGGLSGEFSNDMLERLGILKGEGDVLHHYSRGQSFGGTVNMASPGTVQVRVFAFPGWQVMLNGDLHAFRPSPPHGLIELDVPSGRHRIDVRMGTTPVRTVGMVLSGLTLLALLGLWGYARIAPSSDP